MKAAEFVVPFFVGRWDLEKKQGRIYKNFIVFNFSFTPVSYFPPYLYQQQNLLTSPKTSTPYPHSPQSRKTIARFPYFLTSYDPYTAHSQPVTLPPLP